MNEDAAADGRPPVRVTHPGTGVSFVVPGDWEVALDVDDRAVAVAIEPETGLPHRPNVVVTVDRLEVATTVQDWASLNEQVMSEQLDDLLLLASRPSRVAGRDGWYRAFHHTNADGVSLTSEQVGLLDGPRGCTLTTTVETLLAGSRDPVLRQALGSLAPGGSPDRALNGEARP